MSVVLALGAAVVYGSADFLGGLSSRRRTALAVAFGAQLAGVLALLVALPLLGPATVAPRDVLAGAVGGLFGGLGLIALYRCLARGPMSVVAPVTALAASVVPILAGLALGERPGASALLGIAVALAAVVLITREGGEHAEGDDTRLRRAGWAVVGSSLGAGAMFGLFFIALDTASADSGLYPLLGARLASVPLIGLLAVRRGAGLTSALRGPGAPAVVASGVLDMAANVLYLVALRQGMLTVVSAIVGLYPAATVLLAQTVLSERMRRTQLAGLGIAGVAAALVAV